ncbi:hypothetical protein DINM_006735 [Dirofilaria immitis]|nr:hypothetical protein [Dirofilaria immitis]
MVIEFSENEFNEEMEVETTEVPHYDTFYYTHAVKIYPTDNKLCGMLVEQIPSLYIEFMAVEYLLKRVHRVFPTLLANALQHPTDNVRKSAIGAVDTLVEQCLFTQAEEKGMKGKNSAVAAATATAGSLPLLKVPELVALTACTGWLLAFC